MVNFVFSGEAGQGIETAGKILSKVLFQKGYYTFFVPEYMSRVRGGCNSCLVKISDDFSPYYSEKIDVLFALKDCAVEHLSPRSKDVHVIKTENNFYAIGCALGLLRVENFDVGEILNKRDNKTQFEQGYNSGLEQDEIKIEPGKAQGELISGNEAFGRGLLKGGCNFISFYPMSPSTDLSTYLCNIEEVISEQAEDEICAINMVIGANYAGARAMTTSAGGGFSLMCEGVSLAGMIESPIVINIAQRPSPATGFPTRDAQEDLKLALYSGHGEFPRMIFAPCTLENSFLIGANAFNLAEKYQVPIFILTQQSFLESEFKTDLPQAPEIENYIVKTDKDYKRYNLESAISPRGIPNYGEGLVCVDSDEHNEWGQITESATIRQQMVEKRLKKLDGAPILEPEIIGNGENLIISWGGNYHTLCAAIKEKNFSLIHLVQLYPIHSKIYEYAAKAKKLILVEQNATGQLGELLGLNFDHKFLKYNGSPISIEEIEEFLRGLH